MFKIADHIEFDAKGRAICPACELEGKKQKNLALVPETDGAYKCFRGHTAAEIRAALGVERDRVIPAALATKTPAPKASSVSPAKIKEAAERLSSNAQAVKWLADRGIMPAMAQHYRLGLLRAKVGDRHLPSISIPIPTSDDATAYYQKKRVAPWDTTARDLPEYRAWSQYGIPQTVWLTHKPETATQTWLCEGEWDAMMLGWHIAHSSLAADIAVACFTCGAGNVPPDSQLDRMPGRVVVFYDLDDPGAAGAQKVAARLKDRCCIAQVPGTDDAPTGWDISDALNAGTPLAHFAEAAAGAAAWEEPTKTSKNPLRQRLVSNDDLLDRAPDYTDWLVPDILTSDELFLLAASPRAGKSLLAMTLAQAIASGGKFLGRPVTQGPVIYIRCEDSETKTKEREIAQGWGRGLPVYWLDKFKLTELPHLEELVEELDARLVVFDTLSRIRDASISESSAEMSQLLEPIQEMCKRHGCAGLLVHHTGKINPQQAGDINPFEMVRGSSAIRATCRGSLILTADDRNYRLCVENGWGKLDLQVLLDANTLQWRLLGNWVGGNVDLSQKDRVLNYLTQVGSANIDQIAEATQLQKRSLYEVLKRLHADEMIQKRGSRTSAVYIREGIQQIQQLNALLNSENTDSESDTGSIQQNTLQVTSSEKVIIEAKSDQKNDHFSVESERRTPGDLLNSTPKPLQAEGFSDSTTIQHGFNTSKQCDESDQTVTPIALDDLVVIRRGRYEGLTAVVTSIEGDSATVHRKGWAIHKDYLLTELRRSRCQFAKGDCVKNPSGQMGYVERVSGDRVYCTMGKDLRDDYPAHLLTLVHRGKR